MPGEMGEGQGIVAVDARIRVGRLTVEDLRSDRVLRHAPCSVLAA